MNEWQDRRKTRLARALHLIHVTFRRYLAFPAARLHALGVKADAVTTARVFSLPAVVAIHAIAPPHALWWNLISFLAFAYTDLLDGALANLERKPTSWWTAIYDPLADKIMIISYVSFFFGQAPLLIGAIILGETLLIIAGLFSWTRNLSAESVKANIWGKSKMVLEVITALLMIAGGSAGSELINSAVAIAGWTAFTFLIMSLAAKLRDTASPTRQNSP